MFMRPTKLQDVKIVFKQIKEDKALGLDGFTVNFFHFYWDLLKHEIWKMVEESQRNQNIFLELNSTFLTLIPNEDKDVTLGKYRPIALCNVLYKIITKFIDNHVKSVLPHLISSKKTGYMGGH